MPWKILYDWTVRSQDRAMRLSNNPYSSIKLGEAAFLITALPSIFLGILALRTICSWIGAYRFVSYLDSRFWPIFIAVTTIFFFYYYFRLVWDSLRQANPPAELTEGRDQSAPD